MGCNFSKEDFFESGALITHGERVYLGCGSFERLAEEQEFFFFCPNFFLDEPMPWLNFSEATSLSVSEFKSILDIWAGQPVSSSRVWERESKKDYESQFLNIMGRIRNKEAKKIVSTSYSFSKNKLSSSEFFKSLKSLFLNFKKSETIYGKWGGGEVSFLGKTPEMLFETDTSNKILKTMALAGTKKNPLPPEELCLLKDEKELYEHKLVVDFLIEKLSSFGKVSVNPTEELHLDSLSHLKTNISLEFKEETCSLLEICQLLHPTPALGMLSDSLGMEFLKEFRNKNYYYFFGTPFGIKKEDSSSVVVVSIRQVCWDDKNTYIPVGCGLVGKSDLEKEWEELRIKTDAVLRDFL